MKKIRTRFAPSPTGSLHIGGIRTALFNWLVARKNKGEFILRIDDTDRDRLVPESVEQICESMRWYGLNWDFIYRQSERLNIYKEHADQLLKNGYAYYCFCTSERLADLREKQQIAKIPSKYDRYCLTLSKKEIIAKLEAGLSHVIRLKMPGEKTVFQDVIRGEVIFNNNLIDDSILLKSDGYPTYHLASVVDDHLMEITHVIRADEWLSSTPKHIALYNAFSWPLPEFTHLPLILAQDKSKLSKRHGATSALAFKDLGYLPEALINFLALLGWNPKTTQEIFSLTELIEQFDLKKINKAGPIFNIQKLDWFNNYYIRNLSEDNLVKISVPFMESAGFKCTDLTFKKALLIIRERLTRLSELPKLLSFFFKEPDYQPELLPWKNITFKDTYDKLLILFQYLNNLFESDFLIDTLDIKLKELIKEKNLGVGETLWPLRVALTGLKESPNPFEVMYVLGKEETLLRLQKALTKLTDKLN